MITKSKLIKQIGSHSLVALMNKRNIIERFCVCSNYNAQKEYGTQWDWGHYFSRNEYPEAYKCLLELENKDF